MNYELRFFLINDLQTKLCHAEPVEAFSKLNLLFFLSNKVTVNKP